MTDTDRIEQLERQISGLKAELSDLRSQLAQAELDQWRARIDDLEVQAHLGSLEAKDQMAPLIENLRNAWLEAREKMTTSASTASEVLETLRNGVERAAGELRSAVLRARSATEE